LPKGSVISVCNLKGGAGNRIDGRTTIGRELFRYEGFGETVSSPIHMRVIFAKAFDTGQWVEDFPPGSAAHREIGTLAELVSGGYPAVQVPAGLCGPQFLRCRSPH
jgi:cellulose biosynthesis protein BcsQ